jgi:hypothetical protein
MLSYCNLIVVGAAVTDEKINQMFTFSSTYNKNIKQIDGCDAHATL